MDGAVKPTVEQIKAELAKLHVNTSQVEIINIESTKAIINPIADSVAYRGNAITVFFSVDSRQDLTTLLLGSQSNLGTIITTNGSRPTVEQVNNKLAKKGIDTSQLEIINIEDTTVSIKPISNSTKYKGKIIIMYFKIANNSQDLTTLLPISQRNLGKVYIGQMPIVDQQKIISVIVDVLNNKYNIDVNEIAIKIDSSQNQAVISSLNNEIYTGSVILNYQLDTSFVTLDYLVPDLHSRKQQVASYYCQHHEDIISAKNDILSDAEFKNLSKVNNFINELNEKVKYKASNETNNAFTRIENNNDNFKDFEDLKQQVYQHHSSFNGKINFDDFINTITNYYNNYNRFNYYQQIDVNTKINQLKTAMCRFYNILAQVYGKDNILRMLQKIELDQQFYENSSQKFVRTSIFRLL